MKIAVSADIAAPPERVFALLADIERWPQTISAIRGVEILTDGPVDVGTCFRETRVMHGREAVEEMTVAAIEPPRRLVLTAENHGARYVAEQRLEPTAEGTRLTLAFEGVPVTLLARLLSVMAVLLKGSIEKALRQDLADVKRAAEAG